MTLVLSLFCAGPWVPGQSAPEDESPAGVPPRRFIADESEAPIGDFLYGEALPSPEPFPDGPEPQFTATPGLNLELTAAADPQFRYGPAPPIDPTAQPTAGGANKGSQQAADSSGYTPASLAQENSDFGNMSINGVDVGEAWSTVQRLMPPGVNPGATEVPIVDPSAPEYGAPGSYNWGGLLAQSLFFNVVENSFRAASEIRRLLANKPFWHDWAASMKQFNMRRWNDGDDFLVNYVGHPMQGAVSGFIEIQNDPVGRELEIGATREYWESRFHAFLWALAYSTHSEISPDGEAGIGNEGGWTYPIRCKTPGCPQWNPRTMHSTNNTGWVDFIITPTVGTLWLLAEDTLDRFVSDRVQGDDRSSLGPAFLRGALNPGRTMANLMRFQAPWYRDRQHDPEIESAFVVHVQPTEEQLAELGPLRRVEIAPYFQTMPVGNPANPCIVCFASPGVGMTVDIAIKRWLSASLAAQTQGGLLGKGMKQNGSTTSYEYGLRFVRTGLHSDLSIAVRPGRVIEEIPQPLQLKPGFETYYRPRLDLGHTAVTLMLSDDLKVTRNFGVRYSFGDTIVRYHDPVEDPPGIGARPFLSWLSKDEFTNRSNWVAEAGPVVRF
jgi:hypothetical protein